MNKYIFFSIIIFFFTLLISCNQKINNKSLENNDLSLDTNLNFNLRKGEIPFDFSPVTTAAQNGEFVLCPSKAFIDEAWNKKGKDATFIYYSKKIVEVGEFESVVKEFSEDVIVPNSLIIPIPANQKAEKGDIVLTWWQSGSGMQRAIVINGDNSHEPIVKYLDLDWEVYGNEQETLKPNSFVKLSDIWQPGTSIAYKDNFYTNHAQIINLKDEKVLILGWAGRMKVVDKQDCIPIPISLELNVGDGVQVPYIGSFTDGIIKKYDKSVGRAWVEIQFGGQKIEIIVPFGDIAKNLIL